MQHTLANANRVDCLLFLPAPTGHVPIDSKFPLENYRRKLDPDLSAEERKLAEAAFTRDVRTHIQSIAGKYIAPPETSEGAVMFIPAEAVFAEIHAGHPNLVEEAHRLRVWMCSPTTLMAVLTTARACSKTRRRASRWTSFRSTSACSLETSRASGSEWISFERTSARRAWMSTRCIPLRGRSPAASARSNGLSWTTVSRRHCWNNPLRKRRKHSSPDLYFYPRGEAKCVRGPSGRGARRLARAGVIDSTSSTASKRNEVTAVLSRASAFRWGEMQAGIFQKP